MSDYVRPGTRFHPTEEEIVSCYVLPANQGDEHALASVGLLNIYKYHPEELPSESKIESNNGLYYFFCRLEKKRPDSKQINRSAKGGDWRMTGKDKKISVEGGKIGWMRTFVFHNGERTGWVMYEYRETTLPSQSDLVFCKIKYKDTPCKRKRKSLRTHPGENNPVVSTSTDARRGRQRRRHTQINVNNAVVNMSTEAINQMQGVDISLINSGGFENHAGTSTPIEASAQLQDSSGCLLPIDHTASPVDLPPVDLKVGETLVHHSSSRLSGNFDFITEDDDVLNINGDFSDALEQAFPDPLITNGNVQSHYNKHTRPKPLEEIYVESSDSETETKTDSTEVESYQELSVDSDEVSTKQKPSPLWFFLLFVLVCVLLSCLLRLEVFIPKVGVIEHGAWLNQSSLGHGSYESLELLPPTLRRAC